MKQVEVGEMKGRRPPAGSGMRSRHGQTGKKEKPAMEDKDGGGGGWMTGGADRKAAGGQHSAAFSDTINI